MGVDSILNLLFPVSCLMCSAEGVEFCQSCTWKISRKAHRYELGAFPFWAGAHYGEDLSKLILLAKEKNNFVARNFLATLIVQSFMLATLGVPKTEKTLFVPIPSSRAANRKRGFRHAYQLATRAASIISDTDRGEVKVHELLRVNRRIMDQSNLNRSQRVQNLSGAYSLLPSATKRQLARGYQRIFLVDDLVTTGTSAREGLATLQEAGFTPSGVLAAGVSGRVFY
jgi:predicted amidophosphoribosyltransferase